MSWTPKTNASNAMRLVALATLGRSLCVGPSGLFALAVSFGRSLTSTRCDRQTTLRDRHLSRRNSRFNHQFLREFRVRAWAGTVMTAHVNDRMANQETFRYGRRTKSEAG